MDAQSWWKRIVGWLKRCYEIPASSGEPGKQHEALTLGQLVMLVADDPSLANRNAFYGCLLFSKVGIRVTNPGGVLQPGTRVTTKDDSVAIPSAMGPDGNCYLVVYCDIPALWAAFPHDAFSELDARVVLEMARSNGHGVIVQNSTGDREAQAAVSKEHVADVLSGRFSGSVVVPPGHKVVVIEPRPIPYFAQCESGVWIAELGSGIAIDEIMARVRKVSEQTQRATIIWILQPIVLDSPSVFDAVIVALQSILLESRDTIAHSAVVPYVNEKHSPMMRRLKDIGLGVHYAGPHGECFIEVHKPDGIVVAWPGKAFSG